jgi:hypothetical protein
VRNLCDLAITGQYQLALMAGGRAARTLSEGDIGIGVVVCMYMRESGAYVVWEPSTLGLARIDTPPSLAPIPFTHILTALRLEDERETNSPACHPSPLPFAHVYFIDLLYLFSRALSPAVYNQNID